MQIFGSEPLRYQMSKSAKPFCKSCFYELVSVLECVSELIRRKRKILSVPTERERERERERGRVSCFYERKQFCKTLFWRLFRSINQTWSLLNKYSTRLWRKLKIHLKLKWPFWMFGKVKGGDLRKGLAFPFNFKLGPVWCWVCFEIFMLRPSFLDEMKLMGQSLLILVGEREIKWNLKLDFGLFNFMYLLRFRRVGLSSISLRRIKDGTVGPH